MHAYLQTTLLLGQFVVKEYFKWSRFQTLHISEKILTLG